MHSVALFPERTHLVGAYALGKAQRVMALLRKVRLGQADLLHGAMEKLTRLYQQFGVDLGDVRHVTAPTRRARRRHRALSTVALQTPWARRFPDPVIASRRAGCAFAHARANNWWSCLWSFPITPTGTD